MANKSQQEIQAAERQVELLVNALQQAENNNGVWLNPTGKTAPRMYARGTGISAFNALILALHSDKNGYDTNQYTLFSEARKRGESVLSREKGVPFNWYNWSHYVNRHNPDEQISRLDYLKLSPEEQKMYKGIKNREIRVLFNIQQTTLPHVDKEKYEKELLYHGNSNARGNLEKEERNLRTSVNQFINLAKKNMLPIRREASGIAHYDTMKDAVYMPDKKNFAEYKDFVREMFRQLATATGHQQRLAREGMTMKGGRAPIEDERKQERLMTELAAGVKCLELGIPAKLSKDSLELVDYWSRELKENPILIDTVESDVNSAIDMIHKVEKDEKVERNTTQNLQQIDELSNTLPKHYYVADEIKSLPDKDTKQFVVVKDKTNKTADVVLPAGASLEVNNEVPGMSKQRIEHALQKDGYTSVHFFNTDGALGYHPDDGYFEGREIAVSKLSNWKIDEITRLDVTDAVKRAGNVDFEKILMLKDDDGKWALFLKPENEKSFSIYPDKTDVNQFFTTLKQGRDDAMEQLRLELANKYYLLCKNHPELRADLFKSKAEDIDMSLIERVNVFKTKPKEDGEKSKILCLPIIKGIEKVKPREVSPEQWQRMWLADDKQEYKTQLAATLFADLLKVEKKEELNEKAKEEVQQAQEEKKKQAQVQQEQKQKEEEEKEAKRREAEVKKVIGTTAFLLFKSQFDALKAKHPDAVFLFRAGSFYETYQQDAKKASEILGITLTDKQMENGQQMERVPFAQFPTHALDTYLPRLIRAGERVAICDPLDKLQAKVKELVVPTKAASEVATEEQEMHEEVQEDLEEQPHLKR